MYRDCEHEKGIIWLDNSELVLLTIAIGCLTNTETIIQTTILEIATQTAVDQPKGSENDDIGSGMITTPTGYQAVDDLVSSYLISEWTILNFLKGDYLT